MCLCRCRICSQSFYIATFLLPATPIDPAFPSMLAATIKSAGFLRPGMGIRPGVAGALAQKKKRKLTLRAFASDSDAESSDYDDEESSEEDDAVRMLS